MSSHDARVHISYTPSSQLNLGHSLQGQQVSRRCIFVKDKLDRLECALSKMDHIFGDNYQEILEYSNIGPIWIPRYLSGASL